MSKKMLATFFIITTIVISSIFLAFINASITPKDEYVQDSHTMSPEERFVKIRPEIDSNDNIQKQGTTSLNTGTYVLPRFRKTLSIRNPDEWLGEYRLKIKVTNNYGSVLYSWPVKIRVIFYPAAYKYSIRIIRIDNGAEMHYQLDNIVFVQENPDYIRAVDIWFYDDLYAWQDYYIYWSESFTNPPVWAGDRIITYDVSGSIIKVSTPNYEISVQYGKIIDIIYKAISPNIDIKESGAFNLAGVPATFDVPDITAYDSYAKIGNYNLQSYDQSIEPSNDVESIFYGIVFVRYTANLQYTSGQSVKCEYLFFKDYTINMVEISGSLSGTMLASPLILDQDKNIYSAVNLAGTSYNLASDQFTQLAYWDWSKWKVLGSGAWSVLSFPVAKFAYDSDGDNPTNFVPTINLESGWLHLARDDSDDPWWDPKPYAHTGAVVIFPVKLDGDMVDFEVYLKFRADSGRDSWGSEWEDPDGDGDGGVLMFYHSLSDDIISQLDSAWGGSTKKSATIGTGSQLGWITGTGYGLEFDYVKNDFDPKDKDNYASIIASPSQHLVTLQEVNPDKDWYVRLKVINGDVFTSFNNSDYGDYSNLKDYTIEGERGGYIALGGAVGDVDMDFQIDEFKICLRMLPTTYDYYHYVGLASINDPYIIASNSSYAIGLYHLSGNETANLFFYNEGDFIGYNGSYPYKDYEDYLLMGYKIDGLSNAHTLEFKTLLMIDSIANNIIVAGEVWKNNNYVTYELDSKVEKETGAGEALVLYEDLAPTRYETDDWSDLSTNWLCDNSSNQIVIEDGWLRVLDSYDQWFRIWYANELKHNYLEIEVRYNISHPTGNADNIADGFVIAFYKDISYAPGGGGSGSLCFGGIGYGVKIDVWQNSLDPAPAMIAIINGSVDNVIAYKGYSKSDLYGDHVIRVRVIERYIEVYLDNSLILSVLVEEGFSRDYGYVGLTGATGEAYMILKFDYFKVSYQDLPGIENACIKVGSVRGVTDSSGSFFFDINRGLHQVNVNVSSGLKFKDNYSIYNWTAVGEIELTTADYTLYANFTKIIVDVKKVTFKVIGNDNDKTPLGETYLYVKIDSLESWLYGCTASEGKLEVLLEPNTYTFVIDFPYVDTGYSYENISNIEYFNATIIFYNSSSYTFAVETLIASLNVTNDSLIEFLDLNVTEKYVFIYPEIASYQTSVYWGNSFSFGIYAYRSDDPTKHVPAIMEWSIADSLTRSVIFNETVNVTGSFENISIDSGKLIAGRKYILSVKVINTTNSLEGAKFEITNKIDSREFLVLERPAYIVNARIKESAVYWGLGEYFTLIAQFKDYLSGDYISSASVWVEIFKGDKLLDSYNMTQSYINGELSYVVKIKPYGPFVNGGEWTVGSYMLRIVAVKGNYTRDAYPLVVDVRERPTILLNIQSFISITWREYYVIQVKYWDLRANTIVPDGKVTFKILKVIGPNQYETIRGTVPIMASYNATAQAYDIFIRLKEDLGDIGSYVILVNATRANYQSLSHTITLVVKEIATEIRFTTSSIEDTWAENITFSFRLVAIADNGTWGLDLPIESEQTIVEFKDINGTILPATGITLKNSGEGYYDVKVESGKLIPGTYVLSLYFKKKYYQTAHVDFMITIKKVEGLMRLRVEGQEEGPVKILKNPLTSVASAKVEILLREITGIPITGAELLVSVYKGVFQIINTTAKEDPYVPGLYKVDLDFTNYDPGVYTIRIELLKFTRNGYEAPAEGHNVTEYITLKGRTEMAVSVEFVGGGVRIAGRVVPILLVAPIFAVVLMVASYALYRYISWTSLPPEVRELIKLIKDIENDKFEYSAPEREDILREIVTFELGGG